MRWPRSDLPGGFRSWWVTPDGLPALSVIELGERVDRELGRQESMIGWDTKWSSAMRAYWWTWWMSTVGFPGQLRLEVA